MKVNVKVNIFGDKKYCDSCDFTHCEFLVECSGSSVLKQCFLFDKLLEFNKYDHPRFRVLKCKKCLKACAKRKKENKVDKDYTELEEKYGPLRVNMSITEVNNEHK